MKRLLLLFFVTCSLLLTANAQQKTITGTVIGDDNLPVIGATVQIKGTTIGAATDLDGKYSISAPVGAILEFRYVGMKTQEVTVGAANTIDVTLEFESIGIDEIVVVGYGTQIKSKVTGSIAKVEGEKLMNIPVPTVEQALQGKTAGVFIESINGKASGTTNMRIRGASSITATNQPLFVVDGIPITVEALNTAYGGAVINPMASVNFNDVASIEILKDAASAAIFGSRGANGVVIITTKKGAAGDSKMNFTIQSGFSDASRRRDFMNAAEYISYFREAAINGDIQEDIYAGDPLGTSTYWQGHVEARLKRYSGWAKILDGSNNYIGSEVDTDWQELAMRRGHIFNADMSAEGGNEKLKYYSSLSFNNREGILVSNGMQKISARLNVDNTVNKYIDLGFSLSLNRTNIDQVSDDNQFSTPMQLVALSPVTPPRDLDGNLYDRPVTTYYNGLLDVEFGTRNIVDYRTIANSYLTIKILDGLKLRNEAGFDLYNLKENARYGVLTENGIATNGYGLSNYGQNQNLNAKSYFDFLKTFGNVGVSAVLGTEFQYTTVETLRADGEEFPLDDLKTLASAGLISFGTSTLTKYSFLSYFSRVNLDYKAKYLLTISGRIDGSSRFGKENRYGFFPAASLGWVLSKENFLANNNFLSFLKLRTSFGLTGNAGISNFGHLGLYNVGSYNSGSGLTPFQIPNPALGWESTNQIDGGIDFGFFKNRISGEFDVYVKNTRDLLLAVPVPATTGYTSMMRNIGSVSNKGFELLLNTVNLSGSLTWNTNFNISYNKNEVTDLGDQLLIDDGGSRYMNVVMVGQPIGVFYGAEYAGVDPANGDALWYVNTKDANGNVIDATTTTNDFSSANFVVVGKPTPDLIGAITNTFSYKGAELSFTFQGVTGNSIHLIGDQWMGANGVWYDNQLRSQLRAWKQPGDITDIPQARLAWDNGDQSRNSRYLSDGAYIKLRSLSLSYELPKSVVSKVKLDRIRVFIQGQNLLTFTKYDGWDPEVSADFLNSNITMGTDFYTVPSPRTVVFGINIGL